MRRALQFGRLAAALGGAAILLVAGCTKAPPAARSSDEIFSEQRELPAIYLTESGQRITSTSGRAPFIDDATGDIAWPALACNRPDCPARKTPDEPFLFISPDPAMYVAADRSIAFDPARAKNSPPNAGQCPECWQRRNVASETAAQQQQFRNWVAPYVLPETAERLADLEAERKRRARRDRHEALTGS